MDSSDALSAIRLVAAIAILSSASMLDWRTRRVGNGHWVVLSLAGLFLLPVQVAADEANAKYLLVIVPILAILADVYLEASEGSALSRYGSALKYGIAVVSAAVLGYLWGGEEYFQYLLAVPIMMILIVAMYTLDIIRGGADAKALLGLTVLFPFYPKLWSLPILQNPNTAVEVLFPFSLVILINAAIIVALLPIGFLVRNLARKELRFPQALLGYMMDNSDIPGKHVWLMERVEDGKHRLYTRPRAEENVARELDLLAGAGHKRVWVTPKIPFIVPILASVVLSTIVGNLLLLLIPV